MPKEVPNKHCPWCGNLTLRFIEECESNDEATKTAWNVDCDCANSIVYIYEFKDRPLQDSVEQQDKDEYDSEQ